MDEKNVLQFAETLSPGWRERVEKGLQITKEAAEQTARKSAEPIPISASRFPKELGMFPFSAPKKIRSLQYTSPKGDFHVSIETVPSCDSIPTIEDEQIIYFMVSKAREIAPDTAHIPQKICFKMSECLEWLGEKIGGRQYNFVINALKRYQSTVYRTNRFNRRGPEIDEGFSLVYHYRIVKINQREAYIEVTLGETLIDSLRAGQIHALSKPIWQEFKKSKSPYRKLLIMKISAYMAKKTEQPFMQSTLMGLCGYTKCSREFRRMLNKWDLPWKYEVEKKGKDYKFTFFAVPDQARGLPRL